MNRLNDGAAVVVTLGLVAAGLASGCSRAEFGESVSLPSAKHGTLLDDFAAGSPLSLPADTPFNLTDSQRSATASGRADSGAQAAGTAHCGAEAEKEGTANAEFQLGHVLDNRGQDRLPVTVRFDVDYTCSLRGDPANNAKADDLLGLRVFVRDSDHRVLKSMVLADAGSRVGPEQWSGRQQPAFDVTLEPGLAYYFVLAGRVAVTGTEASDASAGIEIKSLTIELTPRQ
ncbi:MAG: hypothetical protein GY778_20320 [bacterium]|nr:hypothetical protein [bacterium]